MAHDRRRTCQTAIEARRPLPYVEPQDDLTIPEFVFSDTFEHPAESAHVGKIPCMIEEDTGRKVYLSELQYRTDALYRASSALWNIRDGDIVSPCVPNQVDGSLHAPTHSQAYEPAMAKPSLLVAHVENLPAALEAANAVKFLRSRIVVFDGQKSNTKLAFKSVEDLVN
ncbi:hypothetical protein BV20DRAFT_1116605 [Pilatotrama ljubarskyi]|nr:hypothetical protein BV20DRAFT_1116605 [Pilatotrama ljubarskyi]